MRRLIIALAIISVMAAGVVTGAAVHSAHAVALPNYKLVSVTKNVNAKQAVYAHCPAGYILTGGGVKTHPSVPIDSDHPVTSYSYGYQWYGLTDRATQITVYAICVLPQYVS